MRSCAALGHSGVTRVTAVGRKKLDISKANMTLQARADYS